ncbi:hypothetical protein L249_2018 [Ophiocordyceps polyrhachis-furcata BCC 54312]|uniref:Zn(2)-C6 fungal-type domain-containing protein n=1 Tax=Ophiocordyceps polyrhachis-furcata BCC 54312 TaxID=1330021 RepID=A0A367LN43_9HYPO|nr:hypothetical protein L249_2018 [Ophiocordyceps polyrhachis-furcata BCC 54312]
MTVPLAQPPAVPVKDAATTRKRRRRAPAGGASDDCFTCSKRNIKCDRRRPYCSQCLQIGNECSGYKTQLTWGVGVASRGKLRGLSLPIAKAPPVSREPKKSPARRSRANSAVSTTTTTTTSQWTEREGVIGSTQCGPIDIPTVSDLATGPFSTYDYGMSMSQPEGAACLSHAGWGYSPDMMHHHHSPAKFSLPLMTDSLSSSTDSVSDVDYLSPLSQSYSRDDMPFGGGQAAIYDSYSASQSPPSTLVLDYSRAPTSCPGLIYAHSEPSSSLPSHHQLNAYRMMRECEENHVVTCPGFRF